MTDYEMLNEFLYLLIEAPSDRFWPLIVLALIVLTTKLIKLLISFYKLIK